ncbi:unnamed protein product [Urochloa humidicola]
MTARPRPSPLRAEASIRSTAHCPFLAHISPWGGLLLPCGGSPQAALGRRRPMDGHRFEDGDPFPPRQLISVRRRLEPRPPSTSSACSGSSTTSGWPRGHLDGSRLRHLPSSPSPGVCGSVLQPVAVGSPY